MKISVFGDSVLEGVRLENGKYTRGHELIKRFETEFDLVVDNKSKFGATIDKGLARLKRELEKGDLGDYTVLEYGGNDCAYHWDEVAKNPAGEHVCITPPEKFREIYSEMTDLVCKNGSRPILSTLPPISSRRYLDFVCRGGIDKDAVLSWLGDLERISRWQGSFSEMVAELAREKGFLVFDIRSAFPPCGEELETYLCSDGIHPNLEGQKLIYEQARREMASFLRQ